MHRILALLAFAAMVIGATLAPHPAFAAMPSAHCDQSGMAMNHDPQQPIQHHADASCCPAAAPAALPAAPLRTNQIVARMPLDLPLMAALSSRDPRIEVPPPRT